MSTNGLHATPSDARTAFLAQPMGQVWSATISPVHGWMRALGTVPYPEPATLAQLPTLGPLDHWLADPSITDLVLTGPGRSLGVRQAGDTRDQDSGQVWHADWFPWLVQQLQTHGTHMRLAGSIQGTADVVRPGWPPCRVRYTIWPPPLCAHGPAIIMRVLRPQHWTLDRLVDGGTLTAPAAGVLAACMRAGVSVVVTGLSGSGTTTLVQALLSTLPDQRVTLVEEVPELVTTQAGTTVLDAMQVPEAPLTDLVRQAVRGLPDRLVVGTVRDATAYALLAAARNGTPILTTVRADSAYHGVQTLLALALEAPEAHGQLDVVHVTLKARPLVVVALYRDGQGQRQVADIVELKPEAGPGVPRPEPWYQREATGALVWTGAHPSAATRQLFLAAGALPKEW